MTPGILHKIIFELHHVGFQVVACGSEHPFIIHQLTGSKIYFFADADADDIF
jgi:hypothetical protein